MTAAQEFKKQVSAAFMKAGFAAAPTGLCCEGSEITTLVGFEHGFGRQWFVAVGFHLHRVSQPSPSVPHRAHIYARLEGLFPGLRELILLSGELDEPGQPEALLTLTERVADLIAPRLKQLAGERSLALALSRGELEKVLVRKEARTYLDNFPLNGAAKSGRPARGTM